MPATVPPPGLELLDDLAAPPARIRRSLSDIARANRWFGGLAAVRFGLVRLLGPARPARLRLLDIGTGQGDVPRALVRWLGGRGTTVTVIGVDRHPIAARAAREHGVPAVVADGLCLPLADRSVDVAIMSQIAHHLPAIRVGVLCREAERVARIGVVLADLRPSRAAAWGFAAASRVLGFDAATRTDGVISLGRGFTVESLETILGGARIRAAITRRPGARIVAYWRASS